MKGSHHQFTHPIKKGRVTVMHPVKDFKAGTLRGMARQSDLRFRK
jgi:predicted RNA binding protein YcfA (HicA-like mRNA interferase family)